VDPNQKACLSLNAMGLLSAKACVSRKRSRW
jgi:hypothetical protein